MSPVTKILIANRGEIALRIIRTCREMGIGTVAVYSTADEESPHVLEADQSFHIGGSRASESYLNMDRILKAARDSGADAIHPGYGFHSENALFARRCADEDLIFIGPSVEAMEWMSDKTAARTLVATAGVPYPPGMKTALKDPKEAEEVAKSIGLPVLIKAAAGGGGKGMRIIHTSEEIRSGIKAARSEAEKAFGDGRVYMEKYLDSPRHIEIQIIADRHGNLLHLFERECSIQRRHQKVIEEAPSTLLTDELRKRMTDAAIAVAKACRYEGAGTIEFLVDSGGDFYFLEMNTRLQVEHPVTEWITGLDLVELQIRVAMGEELPFSQKEIIRKGHAIECRIYAEDPADRFLPDTGILTKHRVPGGPGVRIDAGVEEGQEVTIHYDPMISKLSVYGDTREQAIRRMSRALAEYEISGCLTTIPFCSFVMNHPDFISGSYTTHFIHDHFDPRQLSVNSKQDRTVLSIAASFFRMDSQSEDEVNPDHATGGRSAWWRYRH